MPEAARRYDPISPLRASSTRRWAGRVSATFVIEASPGTPPHHRVPPPMTPEDPQSHRRAHLPVRGPLEAAAVPGRGSTAPDPSLAVDKRNQTQIAAAGRCRSSTTNSRHSDGEAFNFAARVEKLGSTGRRARDGGVSLRARPHAHRKRAARRASRLTPRIPAWRTRAGDPESERVRLFVD